MEQRRLDSGQSTLVLGIDQGRAVILYLGPTLPRTQALAELAQLAAAAAPHGELDVLPRDELLPLYDGLPGPSPACRLSRDGQRLMLDTTASFAPGSMAETGRPAAREAGPGNPPDLPAGGSEQLEVHLRDARGELELRVRIDATESGVFRWQTSLHNSGVGSLAVDWLASICLTLPFTRCEWLRFHGFWANEFQQQREALGLSDLSFESRRGRTGHQSWPGIVLGSRGFAQQQGELVSMALEWSGNHRVQATTTDTGSRQLQAGVPLETGELVLAPGEYFHAPAALLAYSAQGMNSLRAQSRRYWQERKGRAAAQRPVHFNSWEGCYFDHDATRIMELMTQAAELGAERFVLDDGWMAGRTGAGVGLGDWRCCPVRYPRGLAPVAARARELGMEFGLWVEPEMATPDSALARTHPHWLIEIPGRNRVAGRQQYLLNLTLPAVREHILECLERLIAEVDPDYLKWDMNRDLAQIGPESGSSFFAMTRGFYALLETVTSRHPGICVEVCAAGGGRSDAGSFARADRLWPSDSMDPMQRFRVMKNASMFLPPAALGWHVGSRRSETSGVSSDLSVRCIVALLGHMGLELDPASLDADETRALQRWIEVYRQCRDWLADADLHYLDDVGAGCDAVLALDAQRQRALLIAVQTAYPVSARAALTRLPALPPDRRYRLRLLNPGDCGFGQDLPRWQQGEELQLSGESLRAQGLRLPFLRQGECALIRIDRVD